MTQDEMIEMAIKAKVLQPVPLSVNKFWRKETIRELKAFAKLVAQHEREACAKVCEQTNDGTPYNLAEACAEAIRARVETIGVPVGVGGWLTTTMAQRTWAGLTYEEESELIRLAHNHAGIRFYIQAAEAKLKEKNT